MNVVFSSQRNNLDASFQATLLEMMSIYADSKIDQDGRVEVHLDTLSRIMGQMVQLRDAIKREIANTNMFISRSASRANQNEELNDDLKKANAANMVHTADQQMNDAKTLYDHHRILLLIKVAIVILILVKGNEIYESYRLVFAGASLACIFVYFMFAFFYLKNV